MFIFRWKEDRSELYMEKLCRTQSRGKNPAMVANDPDLKKFQYIFNLIYRPDQVKMLEHDKAIFGEQGISSYSSRIKKGFHKQNYYGFHKQNYRNCTQFYIEGKFIVKSSYKNSCDFIGSSRSKPGDYQPHGCAKYERQHVHLHALQMHATT